MSRAREVSLTVLSRVEHGGAFAAAALASELSKVRDPREAAFATELTMGVLRRRSLLDDLLERASTHGLSQLSPLVRNILRIGAYQIVFLDRVPNSAAVSEAVDQARDRCSKGLVGLVNALLRNLTRQGSFNVVAMDRDDGGSTDKAAVRLGLPPWVFERLISTFGRKRAFATALAFNAPSRRTLRLNTNRISMSELIDRADYEVVPGKLTPWSVDIKDRKAAQSLSDEGLAVYQDEGAQLAVLAVDPEPGQKILDACAGRGGKTSALAMMTGGSATIMAADRNKSKLERLSFELERQGFEARTITADLSTGADKLGGNFDRVLLDAPCSGTGTMGRRPEIRWRIEPSTIESLTAVQLRLLKTSAQLVAPGGRLVYAVCSLMPEEGAGHREQFMKNNPDFRCTAAPPENWPDSVAWNDGVATLDPGIHGTDGYQILSFTRAGD